MMGKLKKNAMPVPGHVREDVLFEANIDSIENVLRQSQKPNGELISVTNKGKRIATVGAHVRMAELNFDPLAMSVAIAKGEALTKDHPFLADFTAWCFSRLKDIADGKKLDWESELERILSKARDALTDSHVPLALRSDHVKELMGYLYPKLKATEHSGTIQHHLRVKPLTQEEVLTFRNSFDEKY